MNVNDTPIDKKGIDPKIIFASDLRIGYSAIRTKAAAKRWK